MPKVGAFNIEYGAQDYDFRKAVALIRKSGADAVMLAEALTEDQKKDGTSAIAEALGWQRVFVPHNQSAIISRWPLQLVDKVAGVVRVDAPTPFHFISVHLTDRAYQPFQAEKIPYCYDGRCQRALKNPDAIARAAETSRGKDAAMAARAAKRYSKLGPVVLAGDFNEPSDLDWTPRAVAAGLHPVAVPFPTSRRLREAGLVDAYRRVNPDEVKDPGFTWPMTDPGYEHRPDRIDFVYARACDRVAGFEVLDSPSDHKMVVADIEFANGKTKRGGALNTLLTSSLASQWVLILVAIIVVLLIVIVVWMMTRRRGIKRIGNYRPRL
jgi:endonuclease/exonuclease/phosphatase family metal-dependent hydrolase